MTEDKKYYGWTNYETWSYALWINNDEGTQEFWNERAQVCFNDAEANGSFTRLENAALALEEEMKEEANDNMPEVEGFYSDILNAAIDEINFYEVAESIINELDIEEK